MSSYATTVSQSTIADFLAALHGPAGELDAWLECRSETEVRAHVLALVIAERERCAKLCDPTNANRPEDWTECAKVRAECAARIRRA